MTTLSDTQTLLQPIKLANGTVVLWPIDEDKNTIMCEEDGYLALDGDQLKALRQQVQQDEGLRSKLIVCALLQQELHPNALAFLLMELGLPLGAKISQLGAADHNRRLAALAWQESEQLLWLLYSNNDGIFDHSLQVRAQQQFVYINGPTSKAK